MDFARRRLLAIAGGMGVATAAGRAFGRERAAPPPNIIFILADDLGYADVGAFGAREIRTPNIDRIAAEGACLPQSYASSAVCSATRVALMTGRYQYRLRVGLEEPTRNQAGIGLPPDHPTLPSLLRRAGYDTALFGKWHLGALPDFGPLKSGYARFRGFRDGASDYFTHMSPANRKDLWDGDRLVDEQGYLTDLIGGWTAQYIRDCARSGTPFFASVHFNAPHWPWEGPENADVAERLRGTKLTEWDGGSRAIYRKMVERMDDQVGRIMAALREAGVDRNTILVFTSDNGGERFSDTWPFVGRKNELLEGGIRVPAIMRWPGRIRPGSLSHQVTITMDWLPTLLAAAGVKPAEELPPDGINLLPALADGEAPVSRTLCWRYKANFQRAIRDGDMKLLKIRDNVFLFDVAADPMERANLKERQPDKTLELKRKWEAWNSAMLPEISESFTAGNAGGRMADRVGAPEVDVSAVDDMSRWD